MKRYIASDFHNGNDVSDYDRVMSFLDLVDDDADEFLILGDWQELLFSNMNILTTVAPYKYITQKVRDIASRKPVSCVIGNHDWSLGAFASLIEPVKVVQPFAENGVYYTHGHEFDWESFWLGTPVDPIWWTTALPFFIFSPLGLFYVLLNKVLGASEDVYTQGIAFLSERASNYALKNGYHTLVWGHTHLPRDEAKDGIRLVNCGDQVDSRSYAIEENGIIELRFFT